MVRHQQQIAAILQKDPNIDGFMSSVGGGGGGTSTNQGRVVLRLKPKSQRKLTADQLARQLTPKLNAVPGMRVFLQNPPPVRIGARNAKSQYLSSRSPPPTSARCTRTRRSWQSCARRRRSRTSPATSRSRTRRSTSS
jgi:HAE1 family hydrophobic/amphiphilic exporter-1